MKNKIIYFFHIHYILRYLLVCISVYSLFLTIAFSSVAKTWEDPIYESWVNCGYKAMEEGIASENPCGFLTGPGNIPTEITTQSAIMVGPTFGFIKATIVLAATIMAGCILLWMQRPVIQYGQVEVNTTKNNQTVNDQSLSEKDEKQPLLPVSDERKSGIEQDNEGKKYVTFEKRYYYFADIFKSNKQASQDEEEENYEKIELDSLHS